MNTNLGHKLRQLRKETGLSQRQVADAVGVTRGYISQVENGITTPSLETLTLISSSLNRPLEYFLSSESMWGTIKLLITNSSDFLEIQDYAKSHVHAREAVRLSLSYGVPDLELEARLILAKCLKTMNRLYDCLDVLEPGLKYVHSSIERDTVIEYFMVVADTMLLMEQFTNSIYYYEKIIALSSGSKRLGQCHARASLYLGSCQYRQGDFSRAKKSYEHTFRNAGLQGNFKLQVQAGLGLSLVLVKMNFINESYSIITKIMHISKNNHNYMATQIYHNLAIILLNKGQKQEAYSLLRKCRKEYATKNMTVEECSVIEEIADYFQESGDYDVAEFHCLEALRILDDHDTVIIRGRIFRKLAVLHGLKGNIVTSEEYLRLSDRMFKLVKSKDELLTNALSVGIKMDHGGLPESVTPISKS
ncbi:helix-turn-helix domain-containing protein [Ferroacidibacillus organovorans]|uniref:HTH cro/C1-type domain-containing protein n=1 Tax=Ferroacidibacillus organovorans TaxID=1765683 RepID=A0A101XP99_9BACL|nr:helix-turn-helix transcriptional regulator [Ferroacidibacillus organovorans]KUO94916.1 hypothetical protein ATW55_15445 [Ferroacidibacillus organovorans]